MHQEFTVIGADGNPLTGGGYVVPLHALTKDCEGVRAEFGGNPAVCFLTSPDGVAACLRFPHQANAVAAAAAYDAFGVFECETGRPVDRDGHA